MKKPLFCDIALKLIEQQSSAGFFVYEDLNQKNLDSWLSVGKEVREHVKNCSICSQVKDPRVAKP